MCRCGQFVSTVSPIYHSTVYIQYACEPVWHLVNDCVFAHRPRKWYHQLGRVQGSQTMHLTTRSHFVPLHALLLHAPLWRRNGYGKHSNEQKRG